MSDKSAVCGVVCHGLIGKPKPHQVIWRHGINGCVRIGSREFARARFGRRGKLAFKSSDSFVFDFKKIELMRVVAGRAPEVHVGKVVSNAVQFHAFHEEEVFPQGAAILAGSGYHWAEVTDDRVPDAIVAEVDFFALLEEALQKPLFPSRIEQNCSVRFFFTTSKNGVFFVIKIV